MWNYRVFRHVHKDTILKENYVWYAIHECYYDNEGTLDCWTENPVDPYGDTLEELKNCYEMMAKAFTKPILNYIMDKDDANTQHDDDA